jgi:hypothetical protein
MSAEPPRIDSQPAFAAALRWGVQTAIAHDARRIVFADPDFSTWPLDDPALLDALASWLRRPQRRLVLLAGQYAELPRRWPRFVRWRREWAHAIEAWQPPPELVPAVPTLLVCDRDVSVHLADAVHVRGSARLDVRHARQWCERIDALLQRSETAFAVSTLGL